MNKKILVQIAFILIGIVFIFSGFVKTVDPWGTSIKLRDYFMAFDMMWLNSLTMFLSVLLSVAELVIGLMLIFRVRPKAFSFIALLFIAFFTVLTFFLSIYNPVEDCGCFGDAVKLTNWETFFKNLIFLPIILYAFIYNKVLCVHKKVKELTILGFTVLLSVLLAMHCLKHLPLIDFLPYKVGQNIKEGTLIPSDAPKDSIVSLVVYSNIKTGEVKEYNTSDPLCWEVDTSWKNAEQWKFDTTMTKVIIPAYEPPIHDFAIISPMYGDITSYVLDSAGYAFMVVSNEIASITDMQAKKIQLLCDSVLAKGDRFIFLTSSEDGEKEKYAKRYSPTYELCFLDEAAVESMIRSNPGLVTTHNGTIVSKYAWGDIPEVSELFTSSHLSAQLKSMQKNIEFHSMLLLSIVLLFSIFIIYKIVYKNN